MITEHALLTIKSGQSAEFEAAMQEAHHYISRQAGFQSIEILPAAEKKDQYLLLVQWDDIESHRDGFRRSDGYQKWQGLLHGFYDPMPSVEYYGDIIINV